MIERLMGFCDPDSPPRPLVPPKRPSTPMFYIQPETNPTLSKEH
jgi:hypothetical protein